MVGTNPAAVTTEELRNACILIIVYQHAFRPGQLARIKTADVRVFNAGAVHFSTVLTKKHRESERRRVTRRVKREWSPLFIEYSRRRSLGMNFGNDVPKDSYFGLSPDEVSQCVKGAMERLTDEEWTATDLRHTAAQRQVDGGASHISVSEFLGHSNLRTANVYIETSPSQAQRINEALGISIYAEVMKVARTKTIDKAALLRLPPDKQIGGVPHGIPIAGIGGCSMGQSLCIKNPVLSCYTCRKFMPVRDAAIHRHVAEELRPVVLEFANACRSNTESPAYTQLRRMLTAVETVAAGIEEPSGDE